MKWRRVLRGWLRAGVHLALVASAIAALRAAHGPAALVGACAWALVALVLLVRAAFIYLPGFDPLLRVPWRGPLGRRRMAITFDDGPNGATTEAILDVLARHGAKATFFMIGENVDKNPALARKVAEAGHAVGSHTYSHQKLSTVPTERAVDEIDRGHEALARAGLANATLFRAPHGLKTFATVRHLHRRGITPVAWTAGVFDTDCPDGRLIAARAKTWLRPGSILLLHDGKLDHDRRPLLQALPLILDMARARGLELVTIPELLGSS